MAARILAGGTGGEAVAESDSLRVHSTFRHDPKDPTIEGLVGGGSARGPNAELLVSTPPGIGVVVEMPSKSLLARSTEELHAALPESVLSACS